MYSLKDVVEKAHEEDSLSFLYGYLGPDIKLVEDEITSQDRWTTWSRAVLTDGKEYVAVVYGVGSTEMQENEEDIEVYSVKPVEVTVTKYERV